MINPLIKAQIFNIAYYSIFCLFSTFDMRIFFICCMFINIYVFIVLTSLKQKLKDDNRVRTVSINKIICKDFYDLFG